MNKSSENAIIQYIRSQQEMSFRPFGAYVFCYLQFQGASPPAIFLRPFRSLDRDMTGLIVFPRAGAGLQPA